MIGTKNYSFYYGFEKLEIENINYNFFVFTEKEPRKKLSFCGCHGGKLLRYIHQCAAP